MGGVREALVVLIALAIGYGFFLAWKIFSMPREEKNNNFYEPVLSEDNKTPFKEEKTNAQLLIRAPNVRLLMFMNRLNRKPILLLCWSALILWKNN